ncbi:MAG: type II secretion system F family protein [Actinomycetaceae bacterium]|nr:type II secretion system F family protein [Actinomycetaceae bacterium]
MTKMILYSLCGASAGLGMAILFNLYWDATRYRLLDRVALGRVQTSTDAAYLSPVTTWILRLVEAIGSTDSSVNRRLTLLGGTATLATFRLQQAGAAVGGAFICAVFIIPAVMRMGLAIGSAFLVLLVMALGALMGAAGADHLLSLRSQRRQKSIEGQVPDASELLALSVSAGESVPDALSRVASASSGELARELERTVATIRLGTATTRALGDLAARNDSPALDRLCQTLVTAIERGSPLTAVLHDQARDTREAARAALMEEGGKREIAMLIPVVFLVLPITVLFALYPGLMVLRLTP